MSSVIKNEYLDSHLQAKRRHTGVGALFYSQLSSNFIYHPALWKNNVKKRKMLGTDGIVYIGNTASADSLTLS